MGLLNSLISSYELPTLFSCEEMDGLYRSLLPAIKRDFPSEQIDPEQYFVARICQNLRLVICVTPNDPLLGEQARYKSYVYCTLSHTVVYTLYYVYIVEPL